MKRPKWLRARATTAGLCIASAVATLTAGSTAWAYFSDRATVTASLTTQSVSVFQNNLANSIQAPFTNEKLSLTGWFQVTNSSSAAYPMNVSLTGTDSISAAFAVTAWPITDTATCTDQAAVGPGAVTGTLASLKLANRVSTPAGGTNSYCVRYSVPERQALASTQGNTVTAGIRADFSLDDTGWSGIAGTRSAQFLTSGIYPGDGAAWKPTLSSNYNLIRGTNVCLTTVGYATTVGTAATMGSCIAAPRVMWTFLPVNPSDTSLFSLRLYADLTKAAAQDPGGAIVLAAYSAPDPRQQWRLQVLPDGRRLFVNQATGKCLPTAAAGTALAATSCTQFATTGLTYLRMPVSVKYLAGTSTTPLYGTILTAGAAVASTVRLQRNVAGAWVDFASTLDNYRRRFDATGLAAGNHEIRVLNALNQVVDQGVINVTPATPQVGGGSVTPVSGWDLDDNRPATGP